MFVSDMSITYEMFNMENFTVKMTNVYQRGLFKQDIVDFMRRIVNEDISETIYEKMI